MRKAEPCNLAQCFLNDSDEEYRRKRRPSGVSSFLFQLVLLAVVSVIVDQVELVHSFANTHCRPLIRVIVNHV